MQILFQNATKFKFIKPMEKTLLFEIVMMVTDTKLKTITRIKTKACTNDKMMGNKISE